MSEVGRMEFFADRMSRFEPTASSVATAKARELVDRGRDVILLTQGEPDFPTPEHVKLAAINALENNKTYYTPTGGTAEMKEAISFKFKRDNNLAYNQDQIIAGNGGKQIIFSAMVTTIEEGDEAIIAAPYWVAYPDIVKFVGGIPKIIRCKEINKFKIQPDELEAAITPRTKWLFLNSPGNPSGNVYNDSELAGLGEVLLRHPQVRVLSDDIYEHIIFDGINFCTLASIVPDLYDRVLTVNGVSKAYSMTGWRLGYAGGPKDLIKQMTKLQNQNTGNPCSISQAAAVAALTGPQNYLKERALEFQTRRDFVVNKINDIGGLRCFAPDGAFYVFINCSGLIGRRQPTGKMTSTDKDVVLYLLENVGVAGVHGEAYGLSPYIRLSTAASIENLTEACNRIRSASQSLF